MTGPRAFACAVALLALAGCGDSSGPDTTTSPTGLWDFTFDGIYTGFGGTVQNKCHTQFTIKLEETPPGSPYDLQARVPLINAVPYCNGFPLQGTFPATYLLIHHENGRLTFVVDNGGEVLVVATYHGTSMDGKVATRNLEFLGPNFFATRYIGTADPNEAPALVQVQSGDHLQVGDSMLVSGTTLTGYGVAPADQTLAWSSSNPAIAAIEGRASDQSGALALVRAVKPGTVYIKGAVGSVADSVQLTVLAGAAMGLLPK